MPVLTVAVKIILGLFGMGIVVFVHELGHFLAARATGIGVEAFSIGWGKPLLKKTIGGVEYRVGIFPAGGYCKMRGEGDFNTAWENAKNGIPPEPGSYYGTSPIRRILVSLGGPFFNLVFAAIVLSVIWGAGFEMNTLDNRIILASEFQDGETYPADEAGLATGDRIVKINGRDTANYHDVQNAIAPNPEKTLTFTVERGGETVEIPVRPQLDRSTGAGRIGVYFWTDPVIENAAPGSPAEAAGFLPGDRILRINGEDFPHTMTLLKVMRSEPALLHIEFEREGTDRTAEIPLVWENHATEEPGFVWKTIRYRAPRRGPADALVQGISETSRTFVLSVKSLSLLFRGIDLSRAVSGPVRITWMAGSAAAEGFDEGIGSGLRSMMNFLALVSIALSIMNLLPLPVLDGGMIVLCIVEAVKRKPLNPKAVIAFNTTGVVLIAALMIFAIFGDILFLAGN